MEDINAHYSIGDTMTFEQMVQTKKEEKELSLYNPFEKSKEVNPYVFEDKPVGIRRFAVLSLVGEGFQQRHISNKCMMKVKVSTTSFEQANKMCEVIKEKSELKFALYVVEMFKFVCLPPLLDQDVDSEMNTAIKMEYVAVDDEKEEFNNRKKTMMDEVKRHNEITKKIADGELDESEAQSAPILPEDMIKKETSYEISDSMDPDIPLCTDRYIVISTLKITKYEKMKDRIIVKICGTFENEADANSHMKTMKKDTKYKLFDVTVCDMYVWLEMPPPYELIENVMFDSKKLTETLGQRKQTININTSELHMPSDE
uniref:Uncharacterized protein n=1 Tax=viral metagenome TaxID=1070528 RepID=A0A6C0IXI4_9ZZZZ